MLSQTSFRQLWISAYQSRRRFYGNKYFAYLYFSLVQILRRQIFPTHKIQE